MRCSNQLSYIAENCGRIILTFNTHVKHNFKKFEKWAYKPGSVEDDHSSRRTITHTLKRPTRIQHGPCLRIPIWSCFWWGLPCRELLPDTRCALTAPFHPYLPFLRKETLMKAVFSLLHLPSAFTAQALPGTLPYEARTFLPCFNHEDLHSSDRLAHLKGRILANF